MPIEFAATTNASPDATDSALAPETLAQMIECLLFVAGEPMSVRDLAKTTESEPDAVQTALRLLRDRYAPSGLQIVEIANGFQMATRPQFAASVGRLLAPHANRLTRPSLETLTIIAYQQPCTQAEVEAIRGVSCDGVLKTLLERDMICEAGRKPTPGRPILYGTTNAFLHYFGLADLTDLPALDEDEEEARLDADEAEATAVHTALAAAGVEADV